MNSKNRKQTTYIVNLKTEEHNNVLNLGRWLKMAKRKAERNAVEKYSKTPHRNMHESEFSAEFSHGEDAGKFANRNSKQGREGRA